MFVKLLFKNQTLFRNAIIFAFAVLVLLLFLTPKNAHAANTTYTQDISLIINGINLLILNGSQSDNLQTSATTFTVTVAGGETFNIRYPGPDAGTLTNDSGGAVNDCNLVGANNDVAVNGPITVVFTPNAGILCNVVVLPLNQRGVSAASTARRRALIDSANRPTFILDGTLKINNDEDKTFSDKVKLSVEANATTLDYRAANDEAQLPNQSWQQLRNNEIDWELLPQSGEQTVYVEIRYNILYTDVISDSIIFEPPEEEKKVIPKKKASIDEPIILNKRDPKPAPKLPDKVSYGMLLRVEDQPGVYFIDNDNRRHVFPTKQIYDSWFEDFSRVKVIDKETLAKIPLGKNVTMRPGTYLVKIRSNPKVYAVEPYGIIRWVQTEKVALDLYGPNWNKKIIDVPVTFFMDYEEGAPLSEHSDGSLIQYEDDFEKYYVYEGIVSKVTDDVFKNNLFQSKFLITGVPKSYVYEKSKHELPSYHIDVLMMIK